MPPRAPPQVAGRRPAARLVRLAVGDEHPGLPGLLGGVHRHRRRTCPRGSTARSIQVRPGGGEERQPPDAPVEADEVLDVVVGRRAQQPLGRVELGELPARAEERDQVADLDGLLDVVGDQHDGLVQLGLEPEELILQGGPDNRVDGAERLVHQQHRRVGGERPGHADPLLLPAGQLVRVAAGQRPRPGRPAAMSSRARARAFALLQPISSGTVAMLSSIVRCGNRPDCWMT